MGEVYRATDTRLGRDVALKLLPDAFASDRARLARLEREAKLLASLSHPNIAGLFALEQAALDGAAAPVLFLAMELAAGEDLAERLKRGPIPVDEAIIIAKQIAEALEEAHEKGIVHRDLKPANVKVAEDGKVKVLDFGLAKAWSGDAGDMASGTSALLSQSPTLAHTGTAAGLILGTAAYMSPEQARGKAVDRRADVWAFGLVLYEMLSGRRPFGGETVTDVLASVVKDPIDWSALPAATPARLRRLLERCLERDPKQRLRDIGEARIALSDMIARPEERPQAEVVRKRAYSLGPLALVALAAAGAGAVAAWQIRPGTPVPQVVRLTETLSPDFVPSGRQRPLLSLSPDGSRLAFVVNQRIYMRSLDSLAASELAGTAEARSPFFSPDGTWLGFSTLSELKMIRLAGGEAVTIAELSGTASWSPDGTILVGAGFRGIVRVAATGGASQVIVAPEAGFAYGQPQVLSGGREFLYTRSRPGAPAGETIVRSLEKDDGTIVLRTAFDARYAPSGHLVYARGNSLLAVAFDLASRRVLSKPVVVVERVDVSQASGLAQVTLSDSGIFAYMPARSDSYATRLVSVTRTGVVSSLPLEAREYSDPRISPDGRQVAVHEQADQNDVWVADLARGALTRLSFAPDEDETPAWSPDGRFIAWAASRADPVRGVFRRAADGSGGEELLWRSDAHAHVTDWTPDGRALVLEVQNPKTGSDLWLLSLEAKPVATPLLATPFGEHSARVSRDGRSMVYVSDESGRNEVYLRSFPAPGAKLQVSTSGGSQPVWARDGRAVFFRSAGVVQEATYHAAPTPTIGAPRALFPDRFESPQVGSHTGYDIFPDGRFLMVQLPDATQQSEAAGYQIVYVFGFLEELKARVGPERR